MKHKHMYIFGIITNFSESTPVRWSRSCSCWCACLRPSSASAWSPWTRCCLMMMMILCLNIMHRNTDIDTESVNAFNKYIVACSPARCWSRCWARPTCTGRCSRGSRPRCGGRGGCWRGSSGPGYSSPPSHSWWSPPSTSTTPSSGSSSTIKMLPKYHRT